MRRIKFIFSVCLLALCSNLFAQQNEKSGSLTIVEDTPTEVEETFVFVEQMPEFPGGTPALMDYLRKNIQYPEEARKMGIEGKVYVKFVVTKLGGISDVTVLRGVEDGESLSQEAKRVVSAMPTWKPGKQNGKPVSVYFTIPIAFKLDNTPSIKK